MCIVVLLLVGMGNYAYRHLTGRGGIAPQAESQPDNSSSVFQCDGRTFCSQMTSCKEAIYFLRHCPNVKMDGDGDGIPCEKQWCN